MDKNIKFGIIGGDNRQVYLANILASQGFEVYTYGIDSEILSNEVNKANDLQKYVENINIIIGPLPFSNDCESVNCKFFNEKVYLEELFRLLNSEIKIFAGFVSKQVHELAEKHNLIIHDYFEREEFQILNCIPTAEGAIKIAIEETPITIHDSNCLILGFGRIGKILSKMLLGIGANIYIEARKQTDLAWIKSYGFKGIHLNNLNDNIGQFDIIFNTIPSMVIDKFLLKKVKKDCLIIDLASKPGGVDFDAAQKLGIKTNWALSLPGKVAPYTTANIVKDTIFNILQEMEV